ncbi:hypothetical protein GIS00_16705 [Nakamurella sp. YIM 132087]|uniref:Uncharacterized protein n=1 Tax=Nakamurella alba TaxID=2665158 RepID=A0A7K1FN32_9ACTN|nr:hypothetical protein [Nakamurella alba]MTD15575.1 hypothetical protein [Nakamurella alba]
MTRTLVAAGFRWDEYPALRVGRLVAGKGDVGRHPRGETHAVADPVDRTTVCGLPRENFPYDFTEPIRMSASEPCANCGIDGTH